MYTAQVAEYKYEIERLTRELSDLKRKYFELKKREHAAKEHEIAAGSPGRASNNSSLNPSIPRFVGGGFSLNQKAS